MVSSINWGLELEPSRFSFDQCRSLLQHPTWSQALTCHAKCHDQVSPQIGESGKSHVFWIRKKKFNFSFFSWKNYAIGSVGMLSTNAKLTNIFSLLSIQTHMNYNKTSSTLFWRKQYFGKRLEVFHVIERSDLYHISYMTGINCLKKFLSYQYIS